MPYIFPGDRDEVACSGPWDAGTLTYALTKACTDYLKQHGTAFATIAEIVSALECAKLELYRRVAAPHEDRKCALNGDVYG